MYNLKGYFDNQILVTSDQKIGSFNAVFLMDKCDYIRGDIKSQNLMKNCWWSKLEKAGRKLKFKELVV